MYAIDANFDWEPRWQQPVRSRLLVSLAIATVVVLALLSVLRIPSWDMNTLGTAIILELLPEVIEEPEPQVDPIEPLPVPTELPRGGALAASEAGDDAETDTASEMRDWYAIAADVASDMAAQEEAPVSVNPGYEKRRQAAIAWNQGVPKTRKQQIWENVEKDQLGRTILVSGDCHRVLDDPNVTRYEWQKEFFQYIVSCSKPTGAEARRKFQAILDRHINPPIE